VAALLLAASDRRSSAVLRRARTGQPGQYVAAE
jgi:hypothetical protein